jgi:hypothetical protein
MQQTQVASVPGQDNELIADGRMPIQAIISSIEADEALLNGRSRTCPSSGLLR